MKGPNPDHRDWQKATEAQGPAQRSHLHTQAAGEIWPIEPAQKHNQYHTEAALPAITLGLVSVSKQKGKNLKTKQTPKHSCLLSGFCTQWLDSPGKTQYKCPFVNKPECGLNTQNVSNNSCLTIPFVLGIFLKVRLRGR